MLPERTIFYFLVTLLLAVLVAVVARPRSQMAWRHVFLSGIGFVVAGAVCSVLFGGAEVRELADVLTFSPDIPSDAYAFSLWISLGYVMVFSGASVWTRARVRKHREDTSEQTAKGQVPAGEVRDDTPPPEKP